MDVWNTPMPPADQFSRDLIWAVNSPALIHQGCLGAERYEAVICQLSQEEIDGDHLRNQMSTHPERRVGRYFEKLIEYWIRHVRGCKVIAHSKQLRVGKRTIGEIDFLYRDERQQLCHLETTVKFYLQVRREPNGPVEYVGPNASDTLSRKTERLFTHQLPMSATDFPEIERRQYMMKGRIFYRDTELPDPDNHLAENHLRGRWIWAHEAAEFLRANRIRYRVATKPHWLAEDSLNSSSPDVLTAEEASDCIQEHAVRGGRAVLLIGLRSDSGRLIESTRTFVVPNDWPDAR